MTPGSARLCSTSGGNGRDGSSCGAGTSLRLPRTFPAPARPAGCAWAQGKYAFRDRNYRDAASNYRKAVTDWQSRRGDESMPPLERLGPPVQLASSYTELGGAQLLAGDKAGAVTTLTQAVKAAPLDSRALFLRARAKDSLGQADAAITDYSLAARTAFANSQDQGSGEGHLYRGHSAVPPQEPGTGRGRVFERTEFRDSGRSPCRRGRVAAHGSRRRRQLRPRPHLSRRGAAESFALLPERRGADSDELLRDLRPCRGHSRHPAVIDAIPPCAAAHGIEREV